MTRPGLACAALCALRLVCAQDVRPTAAITRVESLPQNRVRVSVSIQDQSGKPLTDRDTVRLALFEDNREVAAEQLSSGWRISSVLVIDLSGSMAGEKLEGAKQAAMHYVDQAPAGTEVAIIGFATEISVSHPFTADKALLREHIASLAVIPHARTALNDAVWGAIELLRGREGRRAILALTDGIDNASGREQAAVVAYGRESQATVSTVGLGSDARPEILKGYMATGGHYLSATEAVELSALFGQEAQLLKAEYQLEFQSARPDDGSRRQIAARVELRRPEGTTLSAEGRRRYVASQFIPAVGSHLAPYALVLALLLLVPPASNAGREAISIRRTRTRHVSRLAGDSKLIGALDSSGIRFSAGEPVIICPSRQCRKPHHVRSWRLQRCRCANDNTSAPLCYQRALPGWLRRAADRITLGRSSLMGRKFLCRCAGDPEGY